MRHDPRNPAISRPLLLECNELHDLTFDEIAYQGSCNCALAPFEHGTPVACHEALSADQHRTNGYQTHDIDLIREHIEWQSPWLTAKG